MAQRPGVASVLASSSPPAPNRSVFEVFALSGLVALITGAGRGIGLEVAQAYAEAGATVYCLDLPPSPDAAFTKVAAYVDQLPALPAEVSGGQQAAGKKGKLIYVRGDVTDQADMWARAERIAEVEGRLDICVANAGILKSFDCLDYPADEFKHLLDINVNGVLYTAQAAGRQMKRLGNGGSIIITASMSGSMTNQGQHWTAYNTSKAAVIQMGRSLACELGTDRIRVNTVSPGYIFTEMTKNFLEPRPELKVQWSAQNPLGRIGFPDELRGVYVWLAGSGSTFCTGSDIIVDGGHRAW